MKASKLISIILLLMVFLCFTISTNAQTVNTPEQTTGSNRLAADENLLLQLYVDKGEYNIGDDIFLSGRLSLNGYGITNAQVCPTLKNDSGTELWGSCALTDTDGWFYETLSYGYAISQGYVGYLVIAVTGTYDGQEAYQEMRVSYGLGGGDDDDDGDGVLTIFISPYDRFDFVQGENINYWVEISYNSQPLVDVNICPVVTDAAGNTLSETCARTDASGTASYLLAYNSQIPTGYVGDITVWANIYYEGVYAESSITLTYLPADAMDLPIELELWGPLVPIQIGGWEEIQIGGTVTSQGFNVDGATVNLSVAGSSYQISTGLAESGNFYYGWPNNTFPAGEYTVQVTVSKTGYQSASGTVAFTVFGGEYDFAAVMDAIPAVLPPGTNVPFPGTLTLGGNPVSDWVQIEITHPDGRVEAFSNLSDAAGRFTHTQPSLMALGTYQLVVYYQSDFKQISPVYTFTVGEGGQTPPTVTPGVPPIQVPSACEILEVQYPAPVEAGQTIEVSGQVVCAQDEQKSIPQEGWYVSVSGRSPDQSPVNAPQVQTDSDGFFSASLTLEDFRSEEIFIVTTDQKEGWRRKAYWIGPLKVIVSLTPELSFSQSDFDTGELLVGTLDLNPGIYKNGWDEGLIIIYQVVGPVGGAEQLYLFESPGNYFEGADHFYWQVPPNAESGNYQMTAFISGRHISTKNIEGQFFVNDIRHTQLTAFVEPGVDEWSSGFLAGEFTDYDGTLIPEAEVRVTFQEQELPHREFTLTGKTDQAGIFEIDLEPLDLFAGQGQADPWLTRYWLTTIYADKEGYATGSAITSVATPTISPYLEIVSVDPPLDFLSQKTSAGLNYSQLLDLGIKITVRYNNIFPEGSKLALFAEGNWALNCAGDDDFNWLSAGQKKAFLSINGVAMPEWDHPLYLRSWTLPGNLRPAAYYWYPHFATEMEAKTGFGQESEISVSGQLFGYSSGDGITNPCNTSITNPTIPPDWLSLGSSGAHVGISLGNSQAGVHYRLSPPTLAASGQAWVSPTAGELDAEIRVGQATGFPLARQNIELSIVAKDITSGAETPSSEITVAASATTDEAGKLKLPLTSQINLCQLENKATYFIKISSSAIEGEQKIPIELRCIEKLEFEMNDGAIALVQATDLSDQQPLRLAAGKEAGVRVYYAVRGEIYQPVNKPVSYLVKFELLPSGASIPVETQVKRVSLTEKGATVSWADSSKAPNQAGIGLVTKWEETPTEIEGSDLTDIDFIFTPFQGNGKSNQFKIRITIDPDEVYGQKIEQTIDVTVQTMKTLRLIIVPVNFIDNLDMSFVFNQVEFLHETYPLGISNLILDLRDSYYATEIPLTCASMTYLKEIACGLGTKYGTGGDANTLTKIVGIVENETWQIGWWNNQGTMGAYAATFWDSATTNVALVRYHPYNPSNTTAHEIGHMFGLELSEQYKTNPPNGIPVNGLILKDSQIFDISSDYQIPKMTGGDRTKTVNSQWGASFGSTTSGITDLMGNAGYYLHENGKDVVAESHNRSWVIPKTYISLLDALADPPDEEIFFVQGIIGMDGFVSLNPMVQMEGLPDEPSTAGEYELQIQSSAGEILYNTRFGSAAKPGLFELHIPYTPGMGRMVVLNGGAMVGELLRSPNPPQVSFSPSPVSAAASEMVTVSWTGSDPDGDALTYSLHYNCDESASWVPLVANLMANTYEINLTHMPGGTCTLKVTASDGVNNAVAVLDLVSPPQGPRVQILTEAATYHAEEPVLLKGLAVDLLYGVLPDENLRWYSDIDGELGVGSALWVRLSPGNHTLTLYAQDSAGNISVAQVVIQVEEENPLTGMGNGLQGLCFIGFLIVAALLGLGMVFTLVRVLRKRSQSASTQPLVAQQGAVQDQQGRWWQQDANTGAWFLWNGQAWQPVMAAPSYLVVPPSVSEKKQGAGGSCPLSLLISGIIGLIVVGGISLVAFNFFPAYQITPGVGDPTQILKMGGGGLLVTLLGLLLLYGGFKAILTRRAIVEDERGRRSEKRGCSAVLNGVGQLFFGALCLVGGLGWITLVFYQEVLPWLGF